MLSTHYGLPSSPTEDGLESWVCLHPAKVHYNKLVTIGDGWKGPTTLEGDHLDDLIRDSGMLYPLA